MSLSDKVKSAVTHNRLAYQRIRVNNANKNGEIRLGTLN